MAPSTSRKQSFLLRLPASVREQAHRLAQEDGTSLNHFISLAVAERISRMDRVAVAGSERNPGNQPRLSRLVPYSLTRTA